MLSARLLRQYMLYSGSAFQDWRGEFSEIPAGLYIWAVFLNSNLHGCMHVHVAFYFCGCEICKLVRAPCHTKNALVLITGLGQGALNQGPVGPLVLDKSVENSFNKL